MTSYEIIWLPARSAPSSENLFDDDQPASIAPMIVMPPKAKTISSPASSCAICIGVAAIAEPGRQWRDQLSRTPAAPPKGMTANTSSTGVNTTHGATA